MDLVKIALAGALAIALPFAVLPPQRAPALPLVESGPAAAHDQSETDATRTSDQAPSEPASYASGATGATQALRVPSRTEPPKLTLAETPHAHLEAALEHRDGWSADIEEASRRFGIPSSWVRSVMQVESAGRQLFDGRPITSPAGAMGLMQLMPDCQTAFKVDP